MEGDFRFGVEGAKCVISIHSLRMEGDRSLWNWFRPECYFNPLPPHGGRPGKRSHKFVLRSFQSTPSAWRETTGTKNDGFMLVFQSTPSAWRETICAFTFNFSIFISIHSLRMEGDAAVLDSLGSLRYFNPLPPHGGRPGQCVPKLSTMLFQSTPSAWRETKIPLYNYDVAKIFQSTPSAWRETTLYKCFPPSGLVFQSTPSAWRETETASLIVRNHSHFNPLPPHGGRLTDVA